MMVLFMVSRHTRLFTSTFLAQVSHVKSEMTSPFTMCSRDSSRFFLCCTCMDMQ